jgi:hypothetical protein
MEWIPVFTGMTIKERPSFLRKQESRILNNGCWVKPSMTKRRCWMLDGLQHDDLNQWILVSTRMTPETLSDFYA